MRVANDQDITWAPRKLADSHDRTAPNSNIHKVWQQAEANARVQYTRSVVSNPVAGDRPPQDKWGPWEFNTHNRTDDSPQTQTQRDIQWEIADPGRHVSPERRTTITHWVHTHASKREGIEADAVARAIKGKDDALGNMSRAERRYLVQQSLPNMNPKNAEKLADIAHNEPWDTKQIVAEQFAGIAIDRGRRNAPRSKIDSQSYANLALQTLTGNGTDGVARYPVTYEGVAGLINKLGADGADYFASSLRLADGPSIGENGPFVKEHMRADSAPLPKVEAERRLLTAMIAAPQSPEREAVLRKYGIDPELSLDSYKGADGKPVAHTGEQRVALASLIAQDRNLTPEKFRHVQDMASLANAAYLKDTDHPELGTRDTIPRDWERVDVSKDPKFAGLKLEDKTSGFSASLFRNKVTGKYALAFRGTDEAKDWAANVQQGADGRWLIIPRRVGPFTKPTFKQIDAYSPQYKLAEKLASGLKRRLGDAFTDITGHSLGGGLASYAAMVTEKPATTFNAAGLNDYTVTHRGNTPWDESKISAYRVRGELLTLLQENGISDGIGIPTAAGTPMNEEAILEGGFMDPHTIPDNGLSQYGLRHSLDLHGMDYVMRGLLINPDAFGEGGKQQ